MKMTTYQTSVLCFQVIQYIGELCRYLLAQPHSPSEKQHSVYMAIGNGLRPQIWEEFQSRFGIDKIGEFYGLTEGNVGFFNVDNTPGTCGFTSVILPGLLPSKFIKVDPMTGDLHRDENGLAIQAKPGEPGLAVGKIMKGNKVCLQACVLLGSYLIQQMLLVSNHYPFLITMVTSF